MNLYLPTQQFIKKKTEKTLIICDKKKNKLILQKLKTIKLTIMKKIALLLLLLPEAVFAQTTKAKVLYMTASRSRGTAIENALWNAEEWKGPTWNFETGRIILGGNSILTKNITEIRFDVREEEIPDGIDETAITDSQSATDNTIFDLSGRKVATNGSNLSKGIYIKNGKKYLKK